MNKLFQAAFYAALFTIFGGSIYNAFTMLTAMANHEDVVQVFINNLIGCFFLWGILTFAMYEILGAFEEFNRQGRERLEEEEKKKNKPDQHNIDNQGRN